MKATALGKARPMGAPTRPFATDQGLYWMQLVALVAMVLDHINWFWFAHGGDPQRTSTAWMNDVGRIAFPLFAFTFGVNLARVLGSSDRDPRMRRMVRHLALAALSAQLVYWPLRGYFNPLNVMATFLLTAVVLRYWSVSRWEANAIGRCVALASVVVLGSFVEYWWFGIALIAAAYQMATTNSASSRAAFVVALAALCLLNRNLWALGSLPTIALLASARWGPPRRRTLLYVFYPAHLFAILMASAMITGR